MVHATPAALGIYKPRRPQAWPLFPLVQDLCTACRRSTTPSEHSCCPRRRDGNVRRARGSRVDGESDAREKTEAHHPFHGVAPRLLLNL